MEELRRKLAAAEATIGNLTKEIEEMETVCWLGLSYQRSRNHIIGFLEIVCSLNNAWLNELCGVELLIMLAYRMFSETFFFMCIKIYQFYDLFSTTLLTSSFHWFKNNPAVNFRIDSVLIDISLIGKPMYLWN